MLMAAVVPRDTVVTYKPPRGTKVNLSTADHISLADTGDVFHHHHQQLPSKGDQHFGHEDEHVTLIGQGVRGYAKGPTVYVPTVPSPRGPTNHLVTAELNHCTSSISSLRHANSNGSVASIARAAITRANSLRSANGQLRSSTSSSAALNRTGSLARKQDCLSRASSLGSDVSDRRTSYLGTATEDLNLTVPLDDDEIRGLDDPRLKMVRSNSLTFTPVIVSQQPPRLDQHGPARPISPVPANIQLRRSGVMSDRNRRANYRATKNVSFDCETRTETFETELTESETDEREFSRLMGHYDRRPHLRLPMSPDEEYCPPGKEEEDLLPKVLCFALALIITGGILYGLNFLISRMNMNLFSS